MTGVSGTSSPTGSSGGHSTSRSGAPTGIVFFEELKDWSEIKLRILTKYFDAYQRYRGGSNPRIYYVDGFAGKGRYGGDESSKEGSPVRLAKFAQDVASSQKPYKLICLNVEINPENYSELQRSLADFDPSLVQTRLGAFADHLPSILQTTRGCPALFFLDPFGVKPIKLADLQPLLRRPDTELLLNLNTPRLRKMAGFEDSDKKGRDAKLRLVSEVLGEDPADPTPDWLKEWRRLSDPLAWEGWAAQSYADRLVGNNPHLRFGLTYPVRESYRANPKYHLVFATRAYEAVPVMNDLICTEDDELFTKSEGSTDRGQLTMLPMFRTMEQDDRLAALVEEMYAFGRGHQGCCRDDLIRHFLINNFGQLKQKHYRQALEKLVADGRAHFAKQQKKDIDPIVFS